MLPSAVSQANGLILPVRRSLSSSTCRAQRGPQRGEHFCGCRKLLSSRTSRVSAQARYATVANADGLGGPPTGDRVSEPGSGSGHLSEKEESERLKATLGALDALLGIEEPRKEEEQQASTADNSSFISVSPSVLRQLAEAEAGRLKETKADGETVDKISGQMTKIVEQAKRLADQADDSNAGEEKLRGEFENLLEMLRPDGGMSKEDIKKLKEAAFGPLTFWVTETRPIDDGLLDGGILVKGNLRGELSAVFDNVTNAVKNLFGDKYEVLLVEDPDMEEEDPSGKPRVAFQIMPAVIARPQPVSSWQVLVASVLFLLTFGSACNVGLLANINKLPQETLAWLARPENAASLDPGVLPPGLENFDPVPYFMSALPLALSLLGIQGIHELGHRIAAWRAGVKLGPSFIIPNGDIGTFGGITQFKSLVKDRTALFDVAFAGPALGGASALVIFILGLLWTQAGGEGTEGLVQVPSQLLQGSLLLGSVTRVALGEEALRAANVMVHPFLVAGWCGLVTTALNSLPIGSLDGGRMMQAAFGKNALAIAAFLSYVGLGLGFLGSSLSLPFGLYAVICQRSAERYVRDNVSPVSDARQSAVSILILTAILILLPMAPEVADVANVGTPSMFL